MQLLSDALRTLWHSMEVGQLLKHPKVCINMYTYRERGVGERERQREGAEREISFQEVKGNLKKSR